MAATSSTYTAHSGRFDALELLRSDHRQIIDLLDSYVKNHETMEVAKRVTLVGRLSRALAVHILIEEELFFPALRETVEDIVPLVDVAEVESAAIKRLAGDLSTTTPSLDPRYDAKVAVLAKYVREHLRLVEEQIFPKLRKSALELSALGEQLALRRKEALATIGNTDLQS